VPYYFELNDDDVLFIMSEIWQAESSITELYMWIYFVLNLLNVTHSNTGLCVTELEHQRERNVERYVESLVNI
jgi:hypothetical protein